MVRIDSPEVQEFEQEHLATLRALAPECMVLLKKNGDFPLSAPCEIALYGAGARETIKGGTGSGDVNVRRYVTVEEGLENAGFTVTTKAWMEGYQAARKAVIQGFYEGIAREAKELGKSVFLVGMGRTPSEPQYALPLDGKGEVCVYVLARNSGEGADRPGSDGDYLLTNKTVSVTVRTLSFRRQATRFGFPPRRTARVFCPWEGSRYPSSASALSRPLQETEKDSPCFSHHSLTALWATSPNRYQ